MYAFCSKLINSSGSSGSILQDICAVVPCIVVTLKYLGLCEQCSKRTFTFVSAV